MTKKKPEVTRAALKQFEAMKVKLVWRDATLALGGALVMLALGMWLANRQGEIAWLAVGPTLMAGLLLIKVFIVQHDCGHGSFTASPTANRWLGRACSVLTLTPFRAWAMEHNVHHAQFANLDKDDTGELWLMTVAGYRLAPLWKRVSYRVYRSPLFLLLVAPLALFLVRFRWTEVNTARAWKSALMTDAVLVVGYGTFFYFAGWASVAVMVGAWYVAAALAVVMFYVQHAFEGSHHFRSQEWDFETAVVNNCSQLMLPGWMNFFSGNISYHHLHHLSSKIPSYNLPWAQREVGHLVPATQVRLWEIPKAFSLGLWCEERQQLVGF